MRLSVRAVSSTGWRPTMKVSLVVRLVGPGKDKLRLHAPPSQLDGNGERRLVDLVGWQQLVVDPGACGELCGIEGDGQGGGG